MGIQCTVDDGLGPVHEIEVNVSDVKLLKGILERLFDTVMIRAPGSM